jgi:branched-chain amino acid transport system ATP-binding protein
VRNLCKNFGALLAVDGVNLGIENGHVHSLIGPNGAGKTTVFNCISGFLRPTAGQALLNGLDVTAWPPHRLVAAGLPERFRSRKSSAISPSWKTWRWEPPCIGRNLQCGRARQARRWIAPMRFSICSSAQQAQANADHLAHGDKRLLEIAIAMALQPRVLLLDEPTAGMSPGETERIGRLIRRLTKECSGARRARHGDRARISDEIAAATQGASLRAVRPTGKPRSAGPGCVSWRRRRGDV